MICSKNNEELKKVMSWPKMYEIRKWVNKPILKEVMCTNINFQALEEFLAETNLSKDELFEQYEIEEIETGLMNNEALIL